MVVVVVLGAGGGSGSGKWSYSNALVGFWARRGGECLGLGWLLHACSGRSLLGAILLPLFICEFEDGPSLSAASANIPVGFCLD